MNPLHRIDVHGSSIRGESHATNHDRFAIADLAKSLRMHQTNLRLEQDRPVIRNHQGHVFLVADGLSGGPAPSQASSSAVRSIVDYLLNELPWYHLVDGQPTEILLALDDAFRNAQAELVGVAEGRERGMATMLTLAFVNWPDLFVAHVGDSRAYLSRGGETRLLTTNHPVAALEREDGETERPQEGDRLWNAVGGHNKRLEPQVEHHVLELGDALVLVTDGVHDTLTRERLAALIETRGSARDLCDEILDGTGLDDRTAVVARFLPMEPRRVEGEPRDPEPDLEAAAPLSEQLRPEGHVQVRPAEHDGPIRVVKPGH